MKMTTFWTIVVLTIVFSLEMGAGLGGYLYYTYEDQRLGYCELLTKLATNSLGKQANAYVGREEVLVVTVAKTALKPSMANVATKSHKIHEAGVKKKPGTGKKPRTMLANQASRLKAKEILSSPTESAQLADIPIIPTAVTTTQTPEQSWQVSALAADTAGFDQGKETSHDKEQDDNIGYAGSYDSGSDHNRGVSIDEGAGSQTNGIEIVTG